VALQTVPALLGSYWQPIGAVGLIMTSLAFRRARRAGRPRWRSEWRWAFSQRRVSALLMAGALGLLAGWALLARLAGR